MGLQVGSGSSNGTTTGTTSGTQIGGSNTETTGTQTGQQSVQPTQGWGDINSALRGILGGGGGGLTADQQGATNFMRDQASRPAITGIDNANTVLSQYIGNNHPAYQVGSGMSVDPNQGAAFMGAYQNPYTDQVVNATNADLTQGLKTGLNELRAGYGGSMGNGREGVAAAGTVDDYLRNLASTDSGLRSQGFTTAAGLGQNDASRAQTGQIANQGNQTTRDLANLSSKYQNDQQSMGAAGQYVGNLGQQYGINAGNTQAVYNMSGGGTNNLMNYLGTQTPAFGQSQTGSNTGSQTGYTFNLGQGSNDSTTTGHQGGSSAKL